MPELILDNAKMSARFKCMGVNDSLVKRWMIELYNEIPGLNKLITDENDVYTQLLLELPITLMIC